MPLKPGTRNNSNIVANQWEFNHQNNFEADEISLRISNEYEDNFYQYAQAAQSTFDFANNLNSSNPVNIITATGFNSTKSVGADSNHI